MKVFFYDYDVETKQIVIKVNEKVAIFSCNENSPTAIYSAILAAVIEKKFPRDFTEKEQCEILGDIIQKIISVYTDNNFTADLEGIGLALGYENENFSLLVGFPIGSELITFKFFLNYYGFGRFQGLLVQYENTFSENIRENASSIVEIPHTEEEYSAFISLVEKAREIFKKYADRDSECIEKAAASL